jgi:hypothetical protein
MKTDDLGVTLTHHTVPTGHGLMAGFLVRFTGTTTDIGYVWTSGGSWRWQTVKAEHYGERTTKRLATMALRDSFAVMTGRPLTTTTTRTPVLTQRDADILDAWGTSPARSVGRSSTTSTPRPVVVPVTAQTVPETVPPVVRPVVRQIVWDDTAPAFDVTAALDAAFRNRNK